MLKAVIFDLDGVIINSEPIHAKGETELLTELGALTNEDEYYHDLSKCHKLIRDFSEISFEILCKVCG